MNVFIINAQTRDPIQLMNKTAMLVVIVTYSETTIQYDERRKCWRQDPLCLLPNSVDAPAHTPSATPTLTVSCEVLRATGNRSPLLPMLFVPVPYHRHHGGSIWHSAAWNGDQDKWVESGKKEECLDLIG